MFTSLASLLEIKEVRLILIWKVFFNFMDTKPISLVKNGGILKIPVGFRFHPTDEELVVHYLKRKVHSLPLPAAVIPELADVFQYNPWDLPGDSKEKRYFFGKIRNSNVNRCNQIMISTGSGHWKGIGKEKQVMASSGTTGSNQTASSIIGVRKTLVFYKGKKKRPPCGFRTHWIMHEFQLMGSSATTTLNACHQKLMTEMEGWAVCCIHRKKAKSKRSTGTTGAKNGNTTRKVGKKINRPSSITTTDMATKDNSTESGPPQPPSSPSCSSEVTE